MSTLQKNQHYVWQYHLRAWAIRKKVWCVRLPSDEPFAANTSKLESERYFYRIRELDENDLRFLQMVIDSGRSDELRDLNQGWIELFQRSFEIRKKLGHSESGDPNLAALDQVIGEMEKTMGECFHSSIEARGKPIIDSLRRRDVDFYSNSELALTFIDFISHQFFRTARMRNARCRLPPFIPHNSARTWPIESVIYATNVAAALFVRRDKYKLEFFENRTEVPFVTADQPVINLNTHTDQEMRFTIRFPRH